MYRLGVDLGTTYTAAATCVEDSTPSMLGLGDRTMQAPSLLYLQPDGSALMGEAAGRRGRTDPQRLAREFKRRIGDPTPIIVAGSPHSPQSLTARMLRWVLDESEQRLGQPPSQVTVTHPANWTTFKQEYLRQAIRLAGLDDAQLCPEPVAAALQFAATAPVTDADTELICVYDLGGGTFDACVLTKTADGFEVLGRPEGIEQLGGIDFDQAILQHVLVSADIHPDSLDQSDPHWWRLRADCTEAKEALSFDVDTTIPVDVPGITTTIRLTRNELETITRPAIQETLAATARAIRSANVTAADISTFVLVGGSSRMPLIAEEIATRFRRPVGQSSHPKHDIALGAARSGTSLKPAANPTGNPIVLDAHQPLTQQTTGGPNVMTEVAVAETAKTTEPPSTSMDHPHMTAHEVGSTTKFRGKAWMWAAVAAAATVGIATASMIISNNAETVRTAGVVIPDTTTTSTPSAGPMTSTPLPAIRTLSVLGTAEQGYVACKEPGQTPSITFRWDATDATNGWVEVDGTPASTTPETATPPQESGTSSSGGTVVPFDCASNQHTYTLYLQGAGGTTTTSTSYNASRPSSESRPPSEPSNGEAAEETDSPGLGNLEQEPAPGTDSVVTDTPVTDPPVTEPPPTEPPPTDPPPTDPPVTDPPPTRPSRGPITRPGPDLIAPLPRAPVTRAPVTEPMCGPLPC